jgi:uncharacterized membrane protein
MDIITAISPALDAIRSAFAPYYLYIKFVHLLAVMIWSFSTAVAYVWYVRSAYLGWQRDSENEEAKRRRDWAMEHFDRGVVLEHVAFPVVIITGPLLFIVGGWSVGLSLTWLLTKIAIVVLVFVPMEAVDYWLSHFGGNKHRIRRQGDLEKYERYMARHWLFLRITTPIVITTIPAVIFLAVVKPY